MKARKPPPREVEAEEWWPLATVCTVLNISDRSAREHIAAGRLPASRVAGKRLIRVRKRDALALLEPIPTSGKPAER